MPAPKAPRMASPEAISEMFTIWQAANLTPRTELNYSNGYQLLVAVVCSAQTTDAAVNKALAPVFAHVKNPQHMLALGEEAFRTAIQTIGLFRAKAKNVLALSAQLLAQHEGKIPNTRAALQALPGVGQKTADVVLNEFFGHPAIAVDTHVFRVAHRLKLADAPTPEKVSAQLLKRIPPHFQRYAHHWLILHGRYTCTARAPQCPTCPVAHLCHAPEKLAALALSAKPTLRRQRQA